VFFWYKVENKRAEQVLPVGAGGEGVGGQAEEEVAQIMYTHVSKCKNDKIGKSMYENMDGS
jgi:O-acetyl-ADP-ribose deacetylase (regulator of RNase III)